MIGSSACPRKASRERQPGIAYSYLSCFRTCGASFYLDADVLVLESVASLWELDLNSKPVAAVTNVLRPDSIDRPRPLNFPGSQGYFNAGVMLMNLDLMRREETSRAVLEYGRAHADELVWRDQDAFNAVVGARREVLHPRWNCMNGMMIFPESRRRAGVRRRRRGDREPGDPALRGSGSLQAMALPLRSRVARFVPAPPEGDAMAARATRRDEPSKHLAPYAWSHQGGRCRVHRRAIPFRPLSSSRLSGGRNGRQTAVSAFAEESRLGGRTFHRARGRVEPEILLRRANRASP